MKTRNICAQQFLQNLGELLSSRNSNPKRIGQRAVNASVSVEITQFLRSNTIVSSPNFAMHRK